MENKKYNVAAITIGQSPRADMVEDVFSRLPSDIKMVEYGALDSYTYEQAMQFAPGKDDPVLVSRMRDGRQIQLSGHAVDKLLQKCIMQAEQDGMDAVLLLCTGEFQPFHSGIPIIEPLPVLHGVAKNLAGGKKIAVMVPEESQVKKAYHRWRASGLNPVIVAASPYGDINQVKKAAEKLSGCGTMFLCLDCIGYSMEMKRLAGSASGLPVLLARTLVASITSELLSFQKY